jgi:hypothetical protein
MTTGRCITHRNKDLLIKVPARWREIQARGSTLMRMEVKAVEEPVWLIANAVRWWVFLVPLCLDGARYTPQTDLQGQPDMAALGLRGECLMDSVIVEFEHCYGIKSLKHTFNFKDAVAYAIYAPNGAMKSSFAQTFRDAQLGQESKDRVFPGRTTVRAIKDEAGQDIDGKRVLVVLSYNEELVPTEQTCNLLVNPTLRDEYTKLHIGVEKAKKDLLTALKAQSQTKVDIEAEVSTAIMQTDNQFIHALRRVRAEVAEQDDMPWKDLPYDKIFDTKNIDAISMNGMHALLKDYLVRYDELLAASNFFKKGVFDYYHVAEIARTLAKNGFFKANHTVRLNHEGASEDIQNEKDLQNLVQKEKDAILKDPKLVATFDTVASALDKNAGLRDFRDYLMENPNVVAQLSNVAQFKQDVWKSYFKANEAAFFDLLDRYDDADERRKAIELQAANEQTQWLKVIEIFNSRFVVPFTLEAKNYADVVLGGSKGIDLAFTYHDGSDKEAVPRNELLTILSMGERRALYILNVIFEVQTRITLDQETLLVVDDIADSFDYQNKYAIIQYLKEISDNGLFKQVILTHNFDFFRTVESRLVAYNNCLMAQKTAGGIKLKQALGIKNVFVNDWKKNYFKEDLKKVASIPFLRNLIEFTKGPGDSNYELLTSMLHWKDNTPKLTVEQLDGVYIDVCGGTGSSPEHNKLVVDIIKAEAETCTGQPGSMELAGKVVLAMDIRLSAEKYMVDKLADPTFVNAIVGHPTQALLGRFGKMFPGEDQAFSVLSRVALMTPENIHLNSFMYEPILDMSPDHLIRLQADVKALF